MSHVTDQIAKLHTLADELRVQLHLAVLDEKDNWRALLGDAEVVLREARALGPAAVSDMIERLQSFTRSHKPLTAPPTP